MDHSSDDDPRGSGLKDATLWNASVAWRLKKKHKIVTKGAIIFWTVVVFKEEGRGSGRRIARTCLCSTVFHFLLLVVEMMTSLDERFSPDSHLWVSWEDGIASSTTASTTE